MSVAIMAQIWERAIETTPKLILLKLADHANDQGGSIYPGMESIRLATGIASDSTVKRRLRQFKALGVVIKDGETKRGRGYRKIWRIDLEALRRHFPLSKDAGKPPNLTELARAATRSERGVESPPWGAEERGSSKIEKGGCENHMRGLYVAPESSVTIKNQKPSNANALDGSAREPKASLEADGQVFEQKSPSRSASKRGTRLQEGWQPNEQDLTFARQQRLTEEEIDREARKFRNHWTAKTGRDATKRDWSKTWENWVLNPITLQSCRGSTASRRSGGNRSDPHSEVEAFARAARRLSRS